MEQIVCFDNNVQYFFSIRNITYPICNIGVQIPLALKVFDVA